MKLNAGMRTAGAVCLLFTACLVRADTLPTPAAAARGVYVNGKVYRVLRTGGTLSMEIGRPQYPSSPAD